MAGKPLSVISIGSPEHKGSHVRPVTFSDGKVYHFQDDTGWDGRPSMMFYSLDSRDYRPFRSAKRAAAVLAYRAANPDAAPVRPRATYVDFTLNLKVTDTLKLRQAAEARLLEQGIDEDEAAECLDAERMDLARCVCILLDPGADDDHGYSIEDSRAREYQALS